MSDGFLRRFFDNFGKMPEEKPPIIPQPWRIPFFVVLSIGALVLLVLLVWLVVLPGIRAQQARLPRGPVSPIVLFDLREGSA